mmetsp:Transcript_43562/g.136634  ORF Transcript_43562/g.136634 Transcript_43562/m.136634 type:complete len:206 (-) Transcript_43562:1458-2075(-)
MSSRPMRDDDFWGVFARDWYRARVQMDSTAVKLWSVQNRGNAASCRPSQISAPWSSSSPAPAPRSCASSSSSFAARSMASSSSVGSRASLSPDVGFSASSSSTLSSSAPPPPPVSPPLEAAERMARARAAAIFGCAFLLSTRWPSFAVRMSDARSSTRCVQPLTPPMMHCADCACHSSRRRSATALHPPRSATSTGDSSRPALRQ